MPRSRSSAWSCVARFAAGEDADGVLVPDVFAPGELARGDDGLDAGEEFVEARGVGAALFVAGVELLELEVAEGGGGFRHAVVPAELFGDVALALALGAEHAGAIGDGVVARGEHAAFAGGEVLGGVEAEAAGAERAGVLAVEGRADGLRGVLDEGDAAADRTDP